MMSHDQARLCLTHLGARHSRVAIRIDKVNVTGDKNVPIIRAPGCQDQRAEKRDFNDAQDSATHDSIPNPQSAMRNPNFLPSSPSSLIECWTLDAEYWMFARQRASGP